MREASGEAARKEGGAPVSPSFLVSFRSARVAQEKRTTASGLHKFAYVDRSCSFWDHHRRNWYEIVQISPRGSWQNRTRAQRWAPVHDVATPVLLCSCHKCWFLQLENSSEFAAPHVTSSIVRVKMSIAGSPSVVHELAKKVYTFVTRTILLGGAKKRYRGSLFSRVNDFSHTAKHPGGKQ